MFSMYVRSGVVFQEQKIDHCALIIKTKRRFFLLDLFFL